MTRDSRAYGRLLRDKNLWLLVALLICYTSGQYGFSIWLPTLVKSLTGQNLTTVGWLTALPYLTALGGLYVFGAWSDMTKNPKLCTVLSLMADLDFASGWPHCFRAIIGFLSHFLYSLASSPKRSRRPSGCFPHSFSPRVSPEDHVASSTPWVT